MIVSDLSEREISLRLRRGDFLLAISPFVARLRSDAPELARDIRCIYADFAIGEIGSFVDFHVRIARERDYQHWLKPIVRFYFDDYPSFVPLPAYQAFPMLEWGLNWCIAAHAHQYLIIHAAVIERDGRAAILPAPPGSGKSTLCAGLVSRGWRLLSDELALYDMDSGLVYGMARPINLKNDSIAVVGSFAPQATLTIPVPNTNKGTVALMRPPRESVARVQEPATPAWIVLPRYSAGAAPTMAPHDPAHTFMLLAEQSFNYEIHGQRGFASVGKLVDRCSCLEFTYSRLEDAETVFNELSSDRIP